MRIFEEEQRFTQKWLLVVLTITAIAPIAIITNKMLKSTRGIQWDVYLGIVSLILFGTFCVFLFKLKTRIDEIGIHYKFIPFHFSTKTIVWNDIEKCYTRKYDAISEYGGWGIKSRVLMSKNKGLAYNVKGNMGLQIELKSGKKILIGTQMKYQLERVLTTYRT
jgi:hypothetical protein